MNPYLQKKMVHEFKLIDTTYSPAEAKEILEKLINEKINFFKLMELSNYIKFQEDRPHVYKRIEELKETSENLKMIFKNLPNDFEVELDCPVTIRIKEKSLSES